LFATPERFAGVCYTTRTKIRLEHFLLMSIPCCYRSETYWLWGSINASGNLSNLHNPTGSGFLHETWFTRRPQSWWLE